MNTFEQNEDRAAARERRAGRHCGKFVLRAVDLLIDAFGDPIDGLIFLAIHQAGGEGRPRTALVVTEGHGRPVRKAQIARALRMPRETVRRRIARLVETGFILETQDGKIRVNPATDTLPAMLSLHRGLDTGARLLIKEMQEHR